MFVSAHLLTWTTVVLAGMITAFPYAPVPSTLLVARQDGTPPTPDDNGHCPDTANLCPTGGCCDNGTFCQATDEEGTIFLCVTDRTIPGSTPPFPDDHGKCIPGAQLCPTGGCCDTECLATDDEGTIFVCAPEPIPPFPGSGAPPFPGDRGFCPPTTTICPSGGCCWQGTACQATDEEGTVFVCVTDRTIPGSTDPIPDNNGTCDQGLELCPTGGCCATECLATDEEGTIFVCAPPANKLA